MEQTYRKMVETKQRGFLTFPGTVIAAAKLEMNRPEEALNFLEELEQLAIETHQQMFMSEMHRLRAEALARLKPTDPAIGDEYRRALQLARSQGAWMLELRAATSFATWLARAQRTREAREMLEPVSRRMPEPVENAETRAAEVVLAELR